MLKIIVNCGPCEDYIDKCIGSLRSQTHLDWEAYVTVDACGDRTFERAKEASDGDERIHLHSNPARLYSMANLVSGIRRCGAADEDIIVILDGDDWLYTDYALQIIVETYERHACWMTYGSWVSNRPGYRDRWPAYEEGTTDFRNAGWLATAVRTWKKWLWDRIEDRDFRDESGSYIRVAEDMASMFPMLEMSGTKRARHIPDVLMLYNRANPNCVGEVMEEESIRISDYLRKKPRYQRLED